MQSQTISHLKVGSLLAGNNPRTYFDPVEMADLEASILEKGVIQPILVRPTDLGYAVVAGERRWRAAAKVHGPDYDMPVLVKDISEDEAEDYALIENVARANMSPTEEACAASKILGRCEGNRDEAAKRLGWTRQTLDKRLALMNCSEGVMKALNERKIQLGHAELFAAAPKAMQEQVIVKLLSAPSMPTIAQFKAQLESISKSLASVVFEQTECAGCHHNSGNQQAMFADAIQAGHCTNGACYDQKTMEALEAKKVLLEDEYPRVQIVNPGENFTIIKLVAEGATGVGDEQAKACRACKNFGAAISAVPGKIGNVYKDQCFDSSCNTQKVSARLLAEKAALQAPKPTATKPAASGASTAEKTALAKAKPVVTTVQDSGRLLEYKVKIQRTALKKELFADPRENLSMLIGIMMTRGGSNVSTTKLSSVFEKLTGHKTSIGNVGAAAALVSNADDNVRAQMLSGIVITIVESIEKSNLVEMLTFLQVDMAKHFKLNEEFLTLLTKSEIEVIAEEIGLKAALGDKYSKVMGGKKDEIVKALLAVENFDYVGKVPKVLQYAAAV